MPYTFNPFTGNLDYYQSVDSPSEYDAGNISGAVTIDWSNGRSQFATLTGDCTITMVNPVAGALHELSLYQDGTGGHTVTWDSGTPIQWAGASIPTETSGAHRGDHYRFYYGLPGYLPSYTQNHQDQRFSFLPTQIAGSALILESDINVTAVSTAVSQWIDQSTNAYTGTQSTGANKPAQIANQINGLPIIRFTSANTSYLDFGSVLNLTNTGTGFTWYFVMKFNGFVGSPDYQVPLSSGVSGVGGEMAWVGLSNDASYSDMHFGSPSTFVRGKTGSLPLDTTTFHVFKVNYNGSGASTLSNFSIAQDATSPSLAAAGGFSATLGNTKIGVRGDLSLPANIDLAAIYCYTQPVSPSDETALRAYILGKYGI